MHGKTFTAIKPEAQLVCTVWGQSPQRGRAGVIVAKEGVGRAGQGRLTIKLYDGFSVIEPYETVALGNNSTRGKQK